MSNLTIVICGYPGSGKTSTGCFLAVNHNFIHIEASDIVKECYTVEGRCEQPFIDYVQTTFCSEAAAKFALAISERCSLNAGSSKPIVVTGLRTPLEVKTLKDKLPLCIVIFLKCDFELRKTRKPTVDLTTGLTLEERDLLETEWGLNDIENEAELIIDSSLPIIAVAANLLNKLSSQYGEGNKMYSSCEATEIKAYLNARQQ